MDGIKFRSKLEAYTYKKLKEAKLPFLYEQKTYTLVPKFTPDHGSWEFRWGKFRRRDSVIDSIDYTPDFVCPKGLWIIEVKGFANETFPLRWKLFRKAVTESIDPELSKVLDLYMPHSEADIKFTIQDILSKNINYAGFNS